jgi:hypothetical protein
LRIIRTGGRITNINVILYFIVVEYPICLSTHTHTHTHTPDIHNESPIYRIYVELQTKRTKLDSDGMCSKEYNVYAGI